MPDGGAPGFDRPHQHRHGCGDSGAGRGGTQKFIHLFIGHGIGITPNEPPYIGEPQKGSREVVLEAGMVFAVEPLIWVPDVRGGGGVRLEDTIVVTDGEPEVLNRCGFDERLL
jgi:Xaa-Pro aminopeptidase